MQDLRWERWLEQCVASYFVAVFRPELPAHERLTAAHRFVSVSQPLLEGGTPAREFLYRQLGSDDTQRRNTSARLLSDMVDERTALPLVDAYMRVGGRWLSPSHLVRVARRVPLDPELVAELPRTTQRLRPALLRGLLVHDRPQARHLYEQLLHGVDAAMAEAAVEAVAGWGNRSALWMVLYQVDGTDRPAPALVPAAIRAAQWLGMLGDRAAVDWLEERTGDVDLELAALAHSALGLLGWPSCAEDLADLMQEADGTALAWALEAAANLGSGSLIPALSDVVRRYAECDGVGLDDNPSDMAIRVLERITGRWVPVELSSFDRHGNYDRATRMRAALLFSTLADGFLSDMHYHEGEPLGPHHLVADLLSPYRPRMIRAGVQLVSVTMEDHGFELRDDLIANLAAVEAWRSRWGRPRGADGGRWRWRAQGAREDHPGR